MTFEDIQNMRLSNLNRAGGGNKEDEFRGKDVNVENASRDRQTVILTDHAVLSALFNPRTGSSDADEQSWTKITSKYR